MSRTQNSPMVAMASVAAGALIADAFFNRKNSRAQKDKWLKWKITFKKDISDEEKSVFLHRLQSAITSYWFQNSARDSIVSSFDFFFKSGKYSVTITVVVNSSILFKEGLKVNHPTPPPPVIPDFLRNIHIPDIQLPDIRAIK